MRIAKMFAVLLFIAAIVVLVAPAPAADVTGLLCLLVAVTLARRRS